MPTATPSPPPLPPGPRGLGLWHLLRWVRAPIEFLADMQARYGHTFTLPRFLGRPPMLWLGDPEAVRVLFSDDGDGLDAGVANAVVEGILGGRSLLLLDGEQHRRERKLMMPPFHGERMRAYGATMRDVTERAIDAWPSGRPFPLLPQMHAITLDVILRTVFGLDEGPRMTEIRDAMSTLSRMMSHPALFGLSLLFGSVALRDFATRTSARLSNVGGHDLSGIVPAAGLSKALGDVDRLLFAEFARRRAESAAGGRRRDDVLAMLLDARDEDGRPLSDVHLRDEMVTLLVAGHETTATSLAWAFDYLMHSPEALGRLRDDIAPLADSGPLDPDAVDRLPYLDAVVKEAMRLSPVLPLVLRVARRDLVLGSVHVPAGALVAPNIYAMHRRPDLWPEPENFLPERFLEKKPAPWEYFPFGGGLRRCVGAAFATYEMKQVMATVVARTSMIAAGAPERVRRSSIMFAPEKGTRVVLERRMSRAVA